MIIVGSGVTDHADAKAYYETIGAFVDKHASNFRTEEWQGYNVLQREASRAGAFEVGFTTPSAEVAQTKPKPCPDDTSCYLPPRCISNRLEDSPSCQRVPWRSSPI
ncbi:hypothetical protein LB505_007079 [Fusarium chuoi]|nr:hypothetical protein LB505_007079 [Fusarium chuoi]